jgi:KUP system potassium uptake protein
VAGYGRAPGVTVGGMTADPPGNGPTSDGGSDGGSDGVAGEGAGSQAAADEVERARPRGTRATKDGPGRDPAHRGSKVALVVGATGVVFGDIGTSPLYAMKECWGEHGVPPNADNVLGVASLIFWALTLVVAVKYLSFIMRADNHGEGGVLALLALLPNTLRRTAQGRVALPAVLVLIGAALLYGDGALTPAISVLSAAEGLTFLSPSWEVAIVPLTCVILIGLFVAQSRGTQRLGAVFGPIMICWFALIGVLGLIEIVKEPGVLRAISPTYAFGGLTSNGVHGFLLLGSVILAVTGAEALYADMGHFGAGPIRLSWFAIAMPALVLAYLGQAAMVITQPEAAANPLYSLAPNRAMTLVLFVFATMATVIASQSLISGVFSLTRQAVQLGYFPRVTIRHTSGQSEGQIYIPSMNYLLMVACLLLVLVFRTSSGLAAAYGIAVSGTMSVTSVAFYLVATRRWGWPRSRAGLLVGAFLVVDLSFFLASLPKFLAGGYLPIIAGLAILTVMIVWNYGQNVLSTQQIRNLPNWEQVLERIESGEVSRTPGSAVFLASNSQDVPQALASHVHLLHSLPENVRVVTIQTQGTPTVEDADRFVVKSLGNSVDHVLVRCGFMETPDLPGLMWDVEGVNPQLPVLPTNTVYVLSDRKFMATNAGEMRKISEALYSLLHRNAASPTAYFGLPSNRVVTLGTQVDL